MPSLDLATPVGRLRIVSDGDAVVRLKWIEVDGIGPAEADHMGDAPTDDSPADAGDADAVSRETANQLQSYFARELTDFDLPIRLQGGSPFEHDVWEAMRLIPYGETQTYGDLADRIGGVARAVGGACGRNPIPIIVPCHRVVGAGGRMVGFSGGDGVDTKVRLLDLERGQGALF